VNHPKPRGALSPSECRANLFNEVRAATLFVSDGTRMPNFTQTSPRPVSHGCGHYCYRGMRKGFAGPECSSSSLIEFG